MAFVEQLNAAQRLRMQLPGAGARQLSFGDEDLVGVVYGGHGEKYKTVQRPKSKA
jgi:hypothetical protein